MSMSKENASTWPDLSQPVSNNTITTLDFGGRTRFFSMLRTGVSKRYDAITNSGHVLAASAGRWSSLPPVPGPGRLAATVQSLGGQVYLFGGYRRQSPRS
jgi:hypothetical protein